MTNHTAMSARDYDIGTETLSSAARSRGNALADRLERGANALIALAGTLTTAEWETRIPHDGRKIGVVVHHVASMYPIEIQFALTLASGLPIERLTWADIHGLNSRHAAEHEAVTRTEALELLRANSQAAATAVRSLRDEELDQAAPVSLNADAPLTCQFFIEDHALRHSYHHLARIRSVLGR